MTPNRLEAIRAIVLACAIALVAILAGCASRQASATSADSAVPSGPATSVARPTASTSPLATVDATATSDPGTVTPSPEVGDDASSATAVAGSPTSAQALPAATAAANATPGVVAADTSAVPLFLTVTAPAEELLEVPTGTAEVTISGKTVSSAVLSVNGSLVIPDSSGNFQVTVPVNDDVTLVEVVASDATGAELHEQRVIVRD